MITTLTLGLIPDLHLVLVAHVLTDLAAAAYVTLLIRVHKAEMVRATRTVAPLSAAADTGPSLEVESLSTAPAGTVLHRQAY